MPSVRGLSGSLAPFSLQARRYRWARWAVRVIDSTPRTTPQMTAPHFPRPRFNRYCRRASRAAPGTRPRTSLWRFAPIKPVCVPSIFQNFLQVLKSTFDDNLHHLPDTLPPFCVETRRCPQRVAFQRSPIRDSSVAIHASSPSRGIPCDAILSLERSFSAQKILIPPALTDAPARTPPCSLVHQEISG